MRKLIASFCYSSAIALLLNLSLSDVLHGQDTAGGTRIRVDAAEIILSGRVQMQFNTTSAEGIGPTEMLLRRVRFGATVRINDFVSGRVQPEFAGQAVGLADAYGQLNFSPGLQVIAGRAHRPFTIMEQTTSTQILPIERGVRIRGAAGQELSGVLTGLAYSDRDVGVQVRGTPTGAPLGFSYALAVVGGPIQGASGDNATAQIISRATIAPVAGTRLGLAWSRRDFAQVIEGASTVTEAGNAFALDLEYGGPTPAPGPHLVAQYTRGDFNPFSERTFAGGQVWASYRRVMDGKVTTIEPLVRVSHAEIATLLGSPPSGGTLITPGLNVYLGALNRLMLNLDLWNPAAGSSENSFKAQLQIVF